VIAMVGLALAGTARWRRTGIALAATGTLSLWLLATPLVADALLQRTERYPPLDLAHPGAAQAIVILAGGVRINAPEYHRSAPGPTTLERVVYAARVAHATGLPVLVSGSHAETAAMSDVLEHDLAITPRWVENRSHDTHENARFSAAILSRDGVHEVLLVTSSAHMARSVREFEAAGIRAIAAPAAMWTRRERAAVLFVPNPDALMRSQRALYEVLGLAVQGLRGSLIAHGLLHEPPLHPAVAPAG
jgi:uncharacterized SAM-binding protein YcdF (DUF218 family)